MGKQHLDTLSALTRPFKLRRAGQRTGDLPGVFVDAARNLAGRRVGTAPLLEVAGTTIKRAAPIDASGPLVHNCAAGGQRLALGTGVGVRLSIIGEVRPREGAIL